MQLNSIYLDNSATTKPTPQVVETVMNAMQEEWYNPSALYKPSMDAQKHVEKVRHSVLSAVHAEGERLIFTSSGTEADNLAVLGHLHTRRQKGKVLAFAGEHPAVRMCMAEAQRMGFVTEEIASGKDGCADLEKLEKQLSADVQMIIIMQVNNETGAIQPISEIVAMRNRICPNAAIHVDGVQGFLRVPMDFHKLGIQSYALSGHKIHALKGTGALIAQKNHKLSPLVFGGGQENGYRSGTENTPGILALGTAVETYPSEGSRVMMELKRQLWEGIRHGIPEARLNGPTLDSAYCAPHILNVSLVPVRSQTMLFALEGDGIFVSAGSACSSHKQKVSQVLTALGLNTQEADCALRFSLNPFITPDEINVVISRVCEHYATLKQYVRR
ncbi:MAG: cysteine desulfurase [Clostridia bacterium]|nr:cysteine desulfurase [Clostridia bacterium]